MDLFAARGFTAVRMEDLAQAVGVTPRALYRHYPSKHALLLAVATAAQEPYFAALDQVDPLANPRSQFRLTASRLAGVTLDGRSHALLWQREARHLEESERTVVRDRMSRIVAIIGDLVSGCRSDEDDQDLLELLAWAVLSVLASPGHHTRALPRPATDGLLVAVAESLAFWSPKAQKTDAQAGFHSSAALTSRREQILHAAAQLFSDRGYATVSIEDIGEQVGIVGASVYHHFTNKQDILVTLINRVNEWLTLGVLTAKGAARHPAEAVDAVTKFYVSFALRFPSLVGMTLTESLYLADPEAETLRRARNDIVTEWATMLQDHRPELSHHEAVLLTETVIALTDDLARTPHLREPQNSRHIAGLASAVLSTKAHPSG
ncbi:TetR/AcrR family transcriptional regulator [Mycobacterium syngnathidarum]